MFNACEALILFILISLITKLTTLCGSSIGTKKKNNDRQGTNKITASLASGAIRSQETASGSNYHMTLSAALQTVTVRTDGQTSPYLVSLPLERWLSSPEKQPRLNELLVLLQHTHNPGHREATETEILQTHPQPRSQGGN